MEQKPAQTASNSIRKLTTMGLMAAISVVLVYLIHFPIFPAALYLEYDPADIPIFICTFLYGPGAGFLLSVLASTIQGVTVSAASGWIGILMHIFATGSFALVAGTIYRHGKSKRSAMLALAAGVLTMTAMMVLWNLIFTPIFTGMPRDGVMAILVPVIIPFNLIKAGANALITMLVYKKISAVIAHEK